MDGALLTLLLAAAVLAVATAALGTFQWTQRTYLGFQWWTLALALNLAGAATLCALYATRSAWPWAQLLFVPWPVLCLLGLRRFHARSRLPGEARIDLGLLAALLVTATIAIPAMNGSAHAPLPPLLAAAAALAHAGLVVLLAPAGREATGLRMLGVLWLGLALLPALGAAWLPGADGSALLNASAVALGSTMTAFAVLAFSSQRTERELRLSRRRLRVLANMDVLTQVPNRRRFEELARRALQTDEPGSAALLLVDIDHFKQINDRLGHAAGDRALKLVSRCALEQLRAQDVAGRHGGDEFVLLLRRSSTEHAMQVAERLVSHLQRLASAHALPELSLSFGIVQMRSGESIDETLQRADLALYEAKRLGRSRAVAAEGDDEQTTFRSSQRLGLSAS